MHSTSFTDWISETDNSLVGNTKDLDVVMLLCNFIEYSDNYLKTSGSIWQHDTEEPDDTAIVNSESLKSKLRITGKSPVIDITKNVGTAVPLKCF